MVYFPMFRMNPPDSPNSPLEGTGPLEETRPNPSATVLAEAMRHLTIHNQLLRIHNAALRRQVQAHRHGEERMGEMIDNYRQQLHRAVQFMGETHEVTLEALAGIRNPHNLEPVGQVHVPWVDENEGSESGSEEPASEPTTGESSETHSEQSIPTPQENGWLTHPNHGRH